MPNVIIVQSAGPAAVEEKISSEAITPGHLVEINSGLLRKHATATGAAGAYFAIEATWSVAGNNLTGPAVDEEYPSGDLVPYVKATPEQRINAWLEAGANVAEGALLESGGSGNLQAGTTSPIARAAEAVDNSAGSAAVRILVDPL